MEITRETPVVLQDLVAEYQPQLPYRVLIARVNGKDEELTYRLDQDATVEFLDMRTHSANVAYQNSVSLLYLKAIKDTLGDVPVEIDNSLNKGLYTEVKTKAPITEEQVQAIQSQMQKLVDDDLPIVREVFAKDEATRIWERYNYPEKSSLLEHMADMKETKFYRIERYRNFFFGLMVPSTGYIEYFEVRKYRRGVLLRFPYPDKPDEIPVYVDEKKLYSAFGEAKRWQRLQGVSYLADLNQRIREGRAKELILLCEALHEKKIAEIADKVKKGKQRIILIAGPSSSGKTTFARRLCIQLQVDGMTPLYLGTDDYFLDRENTPMGMDGQPNYEDLEALDIELFNEHMNALLAGQEVDLPEFDFLIGKKCFGRRTQSIRSGQPIVIEGIHALNSKLTEYIDDEEKFKIYISPFTQLNIDVHNRIPTTDARMLRRIVRDYKYRGHSAAETIKQWPKVRAGEDKNIFPYSGEADVLFNSVLTYELALLKKYAYPLLQEVPEDCPQYSEAVRMMKFVRLFDVIEEEQYVPNNSIIREFVGGSVFVE